MIRHMGLIDLIGIKKLITSDRAAAERIIQEFWTRCKGQGLWGGVETIEKWVAFSDSLLLSSQPGADFPKFYQASLALLNNISKINDAYLVLSSGEQIEPGIGHQIIGHRTIGGSIEPTYSFIAGLGDAFANLFLVESHIRANPVLKNETLDARIYVPASLDPSTGQPIVSFEVKQLDETLIKYNAHKRD